MKVETQRKLEFLMFGLEIVLTALEQLKGDGFMARQIKLYANKLYDAIQLKYSQGFKQSTPKAMDYYVRLMDWQSLGANNFSKFDKLSEEAKKKYLLALDNFNTINLR